MLEAFVVCFATFTLTFFGLRGTEWAYHHIRHTPDWSPHWGSWLFSVLLAIYAFVNTLGR
jgi:hypothetical protein